MSKETLPVQSGDLIKGEALMLSRRVVKADRSKEAKTLVKYVRSVKFAAHARLADEKVAPLKKRSAKQRRILEIRKRARNLGGQNFNQPLVSRLERVRASYGAVHPKSLAKLEDMRARIVSDTMAASKHLR